MGGNTGFKNRREHSDALATCGQGLQAGPELVHKGSVGKNTSLPLNEGVTGAAPSRGSAIPGAWLLGNKPDRSTLFLKG